MLQLEDSEYKSATAIKAKKTMELELADLQQQLDELFKAKQEVGHHHGYNSLYPISVLQNYISV